MLTTLITLIHRLLIVVLTFFMSFLGFAQDNRDNVEMQKMADEDQQARATSSIDWKVLNQQDNLRRVRVFELIKENKVQTAKDHFNAGIVFQHGNDTIASSMAVKSFAKALELDASLNRWWYAAAVDRDLMRKGKPQIYGTQFTKNKSTGDKWKRYKIDTTQVTDEQRRYYSVETLAEQQQKEWIMNLVPIATYHAEHNSIKKTIAFIKELNKKGRLSAYSIEAEINTFGYQLLAENKNSEALEIFKLNTKLYPEAFNTFDSYGEALLKLGKKKEGLKAYKKSLELNPQNENAIQVLKANP